MKPPTTLADFPFVLPGTPYAVSAHGTLYRLPGPDARDRVERTCKPVAVQVKPVTVWKWRNPRDRAAPGGAPVRVGGALHRRQAAACEPR